MSAAKAESSDVFRPEAERDAFSKDSNQEIPSINADRLLRSVKDGVVCM